jgi:hypothetical protein
VQKRLFFLFFVAGLLAVLIGSNQAVSSDFSKVPKLARTCIPGAGQVAYAELVIAVPKNAETYYLLSAYQESNSYPSDLIVSVNGKQCRRRFYNPAGDYVSFEPYVGQDVARQFALEQIRRDIQAIGGEKKYQQELLRIANQIDWTPEKVWALQQMGFQLPQNIRIISP